MPDLKLDFKNPGSIHLMPLDTSGLFLPFGRPIAEYLKGQVGNQNGSRILSRPGPIDFSPLIRWTASTAAGMRTTGFGELEREGLAETEAPAPSAAPADPEVADFLAARRAEMAPPEAKPVKIAAPAALKNPEIAKPRLASLPLRQRMTFGPPPAPKTKPAAAAPPPPKAVPVPSSAKAGPAIVAPPPKPTPVPVQKAPAPVKTASPAPAPPKPVTVIPPAPKPAPTPVPAARATPPQTPPPPASGPAASGPAARAPESPKPVPTPTPVTKITTPTAPAARAPEPSLAPAARPVSPAAPAPPKPAATVAAPKPPAPAVPAARPPAEAPKTPAAPPRQPEALGLREAIKQEVLKEAPKQEAPKPELSKPSVSKPEVSKPAASSFQAPATEPHIEPHLMGADEPESFFEKIPMALKIGAGLLVVFLGLYMIFAKSSDKGSSDGVVTVGEQGWSTEWASDAAGSRRARQLTLYRPTVGMSDYQMGFVGQIESKAMGWVFREVDTSNYYAMKIENLGPGKMAITHFAVVEGRESGYSQRPIGIDSRPGASYRVRVDVTGPRFTTYIGGEPVDFWTDNRLKAGAFGFMNERDERGAASSLQLSFPKGAK